MYTWYGVPYAVIEGLTDRKVKLGGQLVYFPRNNSRGGEPRTAAPVRVRPLEEVMGLLLSKERLGVFHRVRMARVSVL
jgi:hypothetical protein